MAIGIYKPGQGYWVRVLTAVGIGVLVLAGAIWGWRQGQAVRLPAKTWTFSASAAEGELTVGETVDLFRFEGASTAPVPFGKGRVIEYRAQSSGRAEVVVGGFDSDATRDEALDTERVQAGGLDNPSFSASVVGAVSTPVIPQLYLQAGIAGGIILIGALGIGWFVAANPGSSDFLIATDAEMKKVNWSTYKQIKGSTIVVIVATFLIAGILFIFDIGFSNFFKAIGVLEG